GIDGVQLVVLGRGGNLAGIGELGEIAIRSPYLARGYLDPYLTAARFVPDLWSESGSRLYRTGDLGRYLPNGEVSFARRADRQVKVRGFRVELGEVEAALAALPGVERAAVAMCEERGEQRLVAYVVGTGERPLGSAELRARAEDRLLRPLVPSAFIVLPHLPLTPNGKVDWRALPAPAADSALERRYQAPATDCEREIAAIWQAVLGVERVGVHDHFFELGGHSLLLVSLHGRLEETLGVELSLIDLFSHPTVASQAEHIGAQRRGAQVAALPPPAAAASLHAALGRHGRGDPPEPAGLAIVGMAGRFPGAADVSELWRNLRAGVESVSFFSDAELLAAGVPPELVGNPRYVKARAMVGGEDLFDAAFFALPPRQAELTDPQHRLFLECCWHALESAGIDSERFPGAIGVYAGMSVSSYLVTNLLPHPGLVEEVGAGPLLIATDRDFLTAQVSYRLGLRGPSLDVQTACSTSLVAVHLACQALLAGDCDAALAGGVSIWVPQRAGYLYQPAGTESSDGHCRAFDARADGAVPGSGAGVVVLKRLADALADGDLIHGVVLGSALSHDGSRKLGFTAPGVEGQAAAVARALARAGAEPGSIGYVECHGSATALGDPIEVTALCRAFGEPANRGRCAIGSVKTNVGHLGAAAGVTGLIKAVLALEHREIPPSLHFETPNPKIDFAASPFYVNDRLADWQDGRGPRRAGVNSLGLGGTNAHVVLQEAPERTPSGASRPWQLLVLSAPTETALETVTERLAAWIERQPEAELADAAFTLQQGRRAFAHRRALVCATSGEARRILAERDPRRLLSGVQGGGRRTVAFLLTGVGDHYPGMARGLYDSEPVFRAELDRCFDILGDRCGRELRDALFAGGARAADGSLDLRRMLGRGGDAGAAARRLHRTRFAQPAVFAVNYALARLWMSWGVEPEALLGYSLGEYVAACLAGIFALEEALPMVAERARWIEELPAGAMLAVPLPEDEVRDRLAGAMAEGTAAGLDLAAVDGPHLCVVSGPADGIAGLTSRLAAEGVTTRRLATTHAFHSRWMEPVAARLTEQARCLRPAPPRIPCLSNVTGTWLRPEEAQDPTYWARHLCGTVRFAEGLGELWQNPARVLLEIGPGQALTALALQHPTAGRARLALPSLPHAHERHDDAAFLLGALGRLWLAGIAIDWTAFSRGEQRRRLELPLYPFERRRFWIEPPETGLAGLQVPARDRSAAA
ncbi:MAG TPA: beta-ketoacyl synthase N-terminal-like domain-containing protein, partial [Thermoanaerobaculia bacterium]|nr:beta-ketoacyl synthase N-terminal-like domain-containing protein [Thermoanaerobaculia bacterium]